MHNGNDQQLEAAVDRVLKALPPLKAPDTLIPRVLAAIEPAASMRWYRRPWQTWPRALQLALLCVAIALCAGLYVGIGQIANALRGTHVAAQLNDVLSTLSAGRQVAIALANAGSLVLARLGTGWLVACGVLVLLSYAACVGLGTIFARLAWARNSQN
jgi:hypothetical protein